MRHRLQPDIVLDQAAYLAVISLSVTAAFLLRFDYSIPAAATPALKAAIGIALLVKLPVFHLTGLHRGLRRFASIPDLRRLFFGNLTASALFVIMTMIWSGTSVPGSVWVTDWLLCFIGTALVRFSLRIWNVAVGRERA